MAVYLNQWSMSEQGIHLDFQAIPIKVGDGDMIAREDLAALVQAASEVDITVVFGRGKPERVVISGAPQWFRAEDRVPLDWPDLIEKCRERLEQPAHMRA